MYAQRYWNAVSRFAKVEIQTPYTSRPSSVDLICRANEPRGP